MRPGRYDPASGAGCRPVAMFSAVNVRALALATAVLTLSAVVLVAKEYAAAAAAAAAQRFAPATGAGVRATGAGTTRVALVFSGQTRLVRGIAFDSFKLNILDRYDVDVYGAFGVADLRNTSSRELDDFVALYDPVALELYDDDVPALLAAIAPSPSYWGFEQSPSNAAKVTALYDALNRSLDLFERASGGRAAYDWVVRCRTDSVVTAMVELDELERGYVYVSDLEVLWAGMHVVDWVPHQTGFLRNEFFVVPGNDPRALQLFRGVDALRALNANVTYYDENLFYSFVFERLALGALVRVTDRMYVSKTRDGTTAFHCVDGIGFWAPFNVSDVVRFSPAAAAGERTWYAMWPFDRANPTARQLASNRCKSRCSEML